MHPCLPRRAVGVGAVKGGGSPTLAGLASAERSGGLQRSETWGRPCSDGGRSPDQEFFNRFCRSEFRYSSVERGRLPGRDGQCDYCAGRRGRVRGRTSRGTFLALNRRDDAGIPVISAAPLANEAKPVHSRIWISSRPLEAVSNTRCLEGSSEDTTPLRARVARHRPPVVRSFPRPPATFEC
jgi:hypothetical protein